MRLTELHRMQPAVDSIPFQQFMVLALLDYPALVHDDDPVCVGALARH